MERPVSNRFRKGIERNLGCRIGHDNLGVKQTNESDEKTNANGNGPFQCEGDGIENGFTDICEGKKNKDKAFNKDGSEGNLPRIPHLQDDRIGKVGIKPHAWS